MRLDKQVIQLAVNADMDAVKHNPQILCWVRVLILAAVQVFPLTAEDAGKSKGLYCQNRLQKWRKCSSLNALHWKH